MLNSHLYSLVVVSLFSVVFSAACIRFNEVPTGTNLGSYHVKVRPQCNSLSTTSENRTEEDGSERALYHELTCGDTTVLIRDNTLTVNGKSYGTLTEGDEIAIDHGKVRVNSKVRAEAR